MRKFIVTALCCLLSSAAWAGSSTVNYSSTGSSPFRTTTDGSSNNLTNVTIWDSAAGANGLSIDASNRAAMNLGAMGGTAINSGCVASLSGLSTAIPATTCGWWGVYVLNPGKSGPQTTPNSTAVSLPIDQSGQTYNTIAASQTAQALTGGSGGATGDYLGFCTIYPTSTSPGVLTVFDNTSTAANNAIAFAGGASSLSNLTPINIPVGSVSVNGAWKVTTGANMVVTCNGHFH